MPAISHPRPTVRARAAGWLPEWLQSSFWNGAASGACHQTLRHGCTTLRRLLLFVPSLQPPTSITFAVAASALLPFTTHSLADYRLHAPYRCSSLIASRSFRCWRNSLSTDKHSATIETSTPRFLRGNVNKRWRKHPRLDIYQHGTIKPLIDHNDTHDEAFGYSGRNWHGHTPSVPTLRRKAWPQPSTHPPRLGRDLTTDTCTRRYRHHLERRESRMDWRNVGNALSLLAPMG